MSSGSHQKMRCRLCAKEAKLRKSHILPEFVFEPLYDSKHRFHVVSTYQDKPRPMEQKGLRERLLCDECEGHIAVYEKHAREVLFGGTEILVRHEGELIVVSEIDYRRLKLFQLSVLWRASVSNSQMFSRVQLGPHEDKIRKMLLEERPGKANNYPCLIFALESESGAHDDFIDQPMPVRVGSHRTYQFVFAGFMWSFYVSSHTLPKMLNAAVLNEEGEMVIGRGSFERLTQLDRFAVNLSNMDRLNKPTE